ncbi:hypothetical protein PR048_028693 [Dryococelus australis]|uniref:Uncharacterized protein n=1 Tax=Dryococelus australis TaxID=614101 RepID=A0ABQ9GE35_9NEOP|nr:hypothetical protein PR048_028693 [Dryococelus australis]
MPADISPVPSLKQNQAKTDKMSSPYKNKLSEDMKKKYLRKEKGLQMVHKNAAIGKRDLVRDVKFLLRRNPLHTTKETTLRLKCLRNRAKKSWLSL